ncbi:TetR/AcrR family transcriptional regulator [Bailinhaonella thermotolerans]|uniref:TetR/AcrR family transcriptional regulator n=1 Tax=Bailinhaonella thermotolerans TaxID=1070861 RepID=A0A3A4AFN1_9ACTN|nr:TetR/AcrR family transcriptional regulator [Bailinhaonella thermotolerans]RJL27169.1 TetR/AcrR family transcriptional regulator [Bailinhaonella thermotolerans]
MDGARRSQADRRARSRSAILAAAARGLSRYGYANLVLDRVAAEAGYTRGALYHQFSGKEDLALAVVAWIEETWTAEVGRLTREVADPVEALLAVARAHAVYCRRDVAGALMTLRTEFAGQDHPVGRAIMKIFDRLVAEYTPLIAAGRERGTLPPGPPPEETARAYLATVEAVVIALAGREPYDAELADRAARGLLGLPPAPAGPAG